MAIFVEDVLALLCLLTLPRGPHLLVACGALLWSLCESRDSTERRGGDSWRDWGRLKNSFYKRSMWFIHGIIMYNPPKMLIEKVSRFLKDDIICSNWWGLNSFQIWWNMSVHLSTQIVFATLLGPILACAYEDDAKVHAGDAASSVLWAFLGGAKNVVSSPYYREHCSGAALFWFRVCLDLSFWTMGTPIHQSVGPTRIFIATWWAFHVGVGEAFTGALVSL